MKMLLEIEREYHYSACEHSGAMAITTMGGLATAAKGLTFRSRFLLQRLLQRGTELGSSTLRIRTGFRPVGFP